MCHQQRALHTARQPQEPGAPTLVSKANQNRDKWRWNTNLINTNKCYSCFESSKHINRLFAYTFTLIMRCVSLVWICVNKLLKKSINACYISQVWIRNISIKKKTISGIILLVWNDGSYLISLFSQTILTCHKAQVYLTTWTMTTKSFKVCRQT